jgi:hypothetical protein
VRRTVSTAFDGVGAHGIRLRRCVAAAVRVWRPKSTNKWKRNVTLSTARPHVYGASAAISARICIVHRDMAVRGSAELTGVDVIYYLLSQLGGD